MSFRIAYGYSHSENGWRMCNRDECVVANFVPHSSTAPLRKGAPATILNAWLMWYHQNVEPLSSPVWGWSAVNDVATSNHLSGTAVDVNAPRYPWGARVMPQERVARVRRGLELFEGTVFWGADWDRADEMHYQMALSEGHPRNEAFAARLSSGYLGIYGKGDEELSASDVKAIQDFVKGFVGPVVTDVKDIREQLAGLGGRDKEDGFPGWPQLGGLTPVDALSVIGWIQRIPGFQPVPAVIAKLGLTEEHRV